MDKNKQAKHQIARNKIDRELFEMGKQEGICKATYPLAYQKGYQDAVKDMLEIIDRYSFELDIDEIDSKEYPEVYKVVEKVNGNNTLIKSKIDSLLRGTKQ